MSVCMYVSTLWRSSLFHPCFQPLVLLVCRNALCYSATVLPNTFFDVLSSYIGNSKGFEKVASWAFRGVPQGLYGYYRDIL